MNFQQLEYAIAVHDQKHFGNAAESCNITQATLSAMIKKLEDELGFLIFDRSRKPVLTTDQGEAFIPKAREILAIRQDLLSLKEVEITQLKGKLRVGVIPTIADTLLPRILPDLLAANPELQLSMVEVTTEDIKQRLATGDLDLGILATPLHDELFDEHIMYYEPMMVFGIEGSKKKFVTTSDIRSGKIWLLEEGHCFRNQSMTICDVREKELDEGQLNFEGNTFGTLLNLTEKFGGYTLIPELLYLDMPEEKQARTRAFQKPIPVREISLISYRPLARKQTTAYLADFIRDRIEPVLSTHSYAKKDLEIVGIEHA